MYSRHRAPERGQILAIFAFGLVALIATVGLVIDGGSAYAQRRDEQNAADVAALAGANALYNGQSNGQAIAAAKALAATNGYSDGVNGATVNVTISNGIVTANVDAPHANYFSGIVGMPTWQVSTTASAIAGVPDTARGAAPIIMPIGDFQADGSPKAQYTAANCAPAGCLWDHSQGGDAPANDTSWMWTVYGPNVNTSLVASYLESFGTCGGNTVPDVTVSFGEHPDWGQHNQGQHNGAISQAGHCIEGLDVAVPVVGPLPDGCTNSSDTDGCFMGWAMFHIVSLEKQGNNSNLRGWFLPFDTQYPNLLIENACTVTTCPVLGKPSLHLIN